VKPVIVLTTVGVAFDAAPLAKELLGDRLAACVNIVPAILSIYRWEDAVEESGEQLLIIKTTDERLDALREALFARHPYEVPEFVVMAVDDIAPGYLKWLVSSVS
jgi:periplasmic divalent cation tolerance protein